VDEEILEPEPEEPEPEEEEKEIETIEGTGGIKAPSFVFTFNFNAVKEKPA
jgi:hypothetical protein